VAFHRATLGHELAGMPGPARTAAVLAWRAFVAAAALWWPGTIGPCSRSQA